MSATRCPSLGSIIVGGKTVGVVQCVEDAGHDTEQTLSDDGHGRRTVVFPTPHRAVLEWENDTIAPDLDLLDPAEELVDPMPKGSDFGAVISRDASIFDTPA
jgi:hypothetical protein